MEQCTYRSTMLKMDLFLLPLYYFSRRFSFLICYSKVNDEKMSIYRNFCASQENPNLRDSLFKDMQVSKKEVNCEFYLVNYS